MNNTSQSSASKKEYTVKIPQTEEILFKGVDNNFNCEKIINKINNKTIKELLENLPYNMTYENFLEDYVKNNSILPLTNYDLIKFIESFYDITLIEDYTNCNFTFRRVISPIITINFIY